MFIQFTRFSNENSAAQVDSLALCEEFRRANSFVCALIVDSSNACRIYSNLEITASWIMQNEIHTFQRKMRKMETFVVWQLVWLEICLCCIWLNARKELSFHSTFFLLCVGIYNGIVVCAECLLVSRLIKFLGNVNAHRRRDFVYTHKQSAHKKPWWNENIGIPTPWLHLSSSTIAFSLHWTIPKIWIPQRIIEYLMKKV